MSLTHSAACRHHALQRLRERIGRTLDPEDLDALEAEVSAGRAVLLSRQPRGREVRLVRWHGMVFPVVYDPALACIVTVYDKAPRHRRTDA